MATSDRFRRLRSDVIVLRSEGGAAIWSLDQRFELRGRGIYEQCAAVLPKLVAGIHSIADLQPHPSAAAAQAISRFVAELCIRGLLCPVDASEGNDHDFGAYQSTEHYLDHLTGHGRTGLRRLRAATVLVFGNGLLGAAAVHALIELGVGQVHIDTEHAHRDRIEAYRIDAQERGKLTRLGVVNVAHALADREGMARYGGVILAGDGYGSSTAPALWQVVRGCGTPCIAGGQMGHLGIAGPLFLSCEAWCLACTREALLRNLKVAALDASVEMSPPATAVLGNQLALGMFRALTGILEVRSARTSAFVADLVTLGAYLYPHDAAVNQTPCQHDSATGVLDQGRMCA